VLPGWARWLLVVGLATAVFVVTVWVAGALILPSLLKDSADRWVVASSLGVAITAVLAAWGPVFADAGSRDRAQEPVPVAPYATSPYATSPYAGATDDHPGAVPPGGIQLTGARRGNQVVITGNRTTVSFGLQSRALIAVVVLALAVAGTTTFVSLRFPPSANGSPGEPSPHSDAARTTSGSITATTSVGGPETSTHYYWPGSEDVLNTALTSGHSLTTESGISELASTITITLQTASTEAVLIKGMRVVNVQRRTNPRAGLFVNVPCNNCGAHGDTRYFSIRLDDRSPQVVADASGTPGGYYYVTAGSPEEFQIGVIDHSCDCTFDLAVDWIDQGTDRSTLLSNAGLHFHTMGSDGLPWYRAFTPGGAASVLVPQAAPTDPVP
jgi:hypothetical protein